MKSFRTSPIEVKTTQFDIDGELYTFTHPKKAALIAPVFHAATNQDKDNAQLEHLSNFFTFFLRGLNKEHVATSKRDGHKEYVEGCTACYVVAKLDDPDDPLDSDLVTEVINALVAEAGDRPTN